MSNQRDRKGPSRRRLLQALGLGGAAAMFPSLWSRGARAGGLTAPKRLVVFTTRHGTVYDNWRMRPGGQSDAVDFEADLMGMSAAQMSPILAPLHAVRDRLLVLDGLAMVSAEGDVLANNHPKGTAHSLTPMPVIPQGNEVVAGGRSIDQLIADEIRRDDLFASLELGVGWRGPSCVFQGPGQALPMEVDPVAVFGRIFPGGMTMGEPTDDDRVRAGQTSVLDFTAGEYEATIPRLGIADRARMETHRDLIRDLERRLEALSMISCDRPEAPSRLMGTASEQYAQSCDAMFQLTAAALACDLTRVVTIQASQLHNPMIGAPAGDVHQLYAHHDNEPEGRQMMTEYHRVHATQFAQLVSLLASVPDIDGGTVLDNTAIVWCGELANGLHGFNNWPVVIAGEAGGVFRSGRYLRWRPTTPTPNPNPDWQGVEQIIGTPHNKMWVSVARAVGLDVDQVGAASVETADGVEIDLTGPLDRLT